MRRDTSGTAMVWHTALILSPHASLRNKLDFGYCKFSQFGLGVGMPAYRSAGLGFNS